MATSGGPDIERDGLVFGMDTGYGIDTNNISSRFYPGEPTTNLVVSPFEINNTTSTDIPQELVGKGITGYASYSSGYSVFSSQTSSTSSTGKTFQYSIWMRSPGGTSTYLLYVYDGTGPDGGWWSFGEGALTDKWQRITGSRSNMTGTVTTIRVYRRNQQGTIEMVAPQLEVKSHVTPFLTGTRSSTQSLIDLTKTTDIDVSNVSFDSTGQPTFDGTDDSIDLGTEEPFTLLSKTATWEAVVKFDSSNANGAVITRWENSVGQTWWFGRYNANRIHLALILGGGYNAFYSDSSMTDTTKYYHIAAVLNGTSLKFFLDGELNGTRTVNSNTWNTNPSGTHSTRIGAQNGGSASLHNGEIPIVKLYDRALSADEVQQNYNAYKNRFNL